MTPIQPMLADACTFEKAVQKLGGTTRLVGEIKYDGERIQVHKTGNAFHYFTRNLKTADEKKIENLAACIRQALPHARDLILDGELLLIDRSGIPLPFGTLGCHKKKEFADATVCYVIFDCLFINGKSLLATPLWKRREMLQENVTEIRGRVQLSEQVPIESEEVLHNYWRQAIDAKLEGIVLKDANGKYEPGKRRWWKLKRDYESNLVDSVDLVVLGAYYGTGNKGGKKSVFLMGCFNPASKRWQTVTKVGNGFDDAEIEHLQKEIDWQSVENELAPAWLDVQKPLVPDFIVPDPCQSPVWEIAGAGFTSSKTHTASGISIRFPRVIRKRADKSWKEATSLQDLRDRFSNAAKETVPTKRKKNS